MVLHRATLIMQHENAKFIFKQKVLCVSQGFAELWGPAVWTQNSPQK